MQVLERGLGSCDGAEPDSGLRIVVFGICDTALWSNTPPPGIPTTKPGQNNDTVTFAVFEGQSVAPRAGITGVGVWKSVPQVKLYTPFTIHPHAWPMI